MVFVVVVVVALVALVAVSKDSTASSANGHPVSVSTKSESRSTFASAALLKRNPHASTDHTSTTQAVILKLAVDHRILTMPPCLRLTIQDSIGKKYSMESMSATTSHVQLWLMQQQQQHQLIFHKAARLLGRDIWFLSRQLVAIV